MTEEEIIDTVFQKYRTVEKKKLIRHFESTKMKPNLARWHKLLIHLALNIGPQTGTNEDIIEAIEEEPAQEDGAAAVEGFADFSIVKEEVKKQDVSDGV